MILPPPVADLPPMHQACLYEVVRDYSLPLLSLLGIWAVEGGKLGQVSANRNGSVDHGPFQINSFWTNKFSRWFGVPAVKVRDDFCVNARAAGWILRYELNRSNGDFWQAVGRYHNPDPATGRGYAVKVKRAADIIYRRDYIGGRR